MKSMDYIEDIKNEYFLSRLDLIDILDYLRYIARDNGEYDADSFLREVQEEIEG